MAFLCPARTARKVKKQVKEPPIDPPLPLPGRITGSASIDTLDRAGLERDDADNPNRRRVILQDFKACNSGELSVVRKQHVRFLYQEHNWNYVKDALGAEGFVPKDVCGPLGSSMDDLEYRGIGGTVIRNKNYNSIRSAPAMPYSHIKNMENGDRNTGFNRFHGYVQSVGGPDLIQHVRRRTAMAQTPAERESGDHRSHQSPEETWHYKNGGFLNQSDGSQKMYTSSNQINRQQLGSIKQLPSFSQANFERSPGLHSLDYQQHQNRSNPSLNSTLNSSPHSHSSPNNSSTSPNPKSTRHTMFSKVPQGNYFVKFDFRGTMENDVLVQRGFFVTLLNKDDPDWYWVVTANQQEGFVPASYLLRADCSAPTDPIVGQTNISNIQQSPRTHQQSTSHHYPSPIDKPASRHSSLGDFHSTPHNQEFHQSLPHHRSIGNFNSHHHNSHQSPADIVNTTFPQARDTPYQERYTDVDSSLTEYNPRGFAQTRGLQDRNTNTHLFDSISQGTSHTEIHKSRNNPRRDIRYRSSDHLRSRNQSLSPTRRSKASSEYEYRSKERMSRQDHGRFSLGPHEIQHKVHNSRSHSSNRDFNVSFGKEITREKKSTSTERLNTSFAGTSSLPNNNTNKLNNIRAEVDRHHFVIRSKSTDGINKRALTVSNRQERGVIHAQYNQKMEFLNASGTPPNVNSSHESNQLPENFKDSHDGWDKLVVIKDCVASFEQALSVKRGDYVLVDSKRAQKDWLWCWSIPVQKHGFVPKSFVAPPFSTAL